MNGPGTPTDILVACVVGLFGGILINLGLKGLKR